MEIEVFSKREAGRLYRPEADKACVVQKAFGDGFRASPLVHAHFIAAHDLSLPGRLFLI